MYIELQGGPIVKVLDLEKLNEYLKIDDIILQMMDMYGTYNVCPVLSLNVDKIENEGPVEYGYIKTKIGEERYNYLINNKIIEIKL